MKWSWVRALPYLLGAGAAVVAALLNYTNTLHVSSATGLAVVMLVKLAGNGLQQYIQKEQTSHPIPIEMGTATLVAQALPPQPSVTINVHPPSTLTVNSATQADSLHTADGENITNAHNA